MATQQTRTLKVEIDITGKFDEKLQGLSETITSIQKLVTDVKSSISGIGTSINAIVVPKSFSNLVTDIAKLGAVKIPNLDGLAKGFTSLDKIKGNIPDLKPFADELKKLAEVGTLPNLLAISKGFEGFITILGGKGKNKIPDLSKFKSELDQFAGISLPNLGQLAKGFETLYALSTKEGGTSLKTIGKELRSLQNIKLPNFSQLANGFKILSELDYSQTSLSLIKRELQSLEKITLPNFGQIANAFKSLSGLDHSEKSLSLIRRELMSLQGIKLPNFSQIANGFKSLNNMFKEDATSISLKKFADELAHFANIKLPNFGQIASGFKTLAELKTNIPNLQPFADALGAFKDIKLPNFGQIASGFKTLAEIKNIPDLQPFADALKPLMKMSGTLPNFGQFSKGMQELAKDTLRMDLVTQRLSSLGHVLRSFSGLNVNIDMKKIADGMVRLTGAIAVPQATITNINELVTVVKRLDSVKIPNIEQLADGLRKFKTIDIGVATAGLTALVPVIQKFTKDMHIPNLLQFAIGLEKITNIKVSDFKDKLIEMNKAIADLSANGKLMDFSAFAQQVDKVSKVLIAQAQHNAKLASQMGTTSRAVAEAGTVWDKFKAKMSTFVQYRVISDFINGLRDSLMQIIPNIINFDQSLKDLQAISGATGLEVSKMSDTIKTLAKDTRFSAGEVAQGLTVIAQAGYSAADSIKMIKSISDLATGTLSDMASAVDLTTSVMTVFDIDARNTAQAVDTLANAINLSKLDVDRLKTAFNYIGPVAADANISFNEVAASMSLLANSGQKASTIGTGLRNVFSLLLSPSEDLQRAATEAGIAIEQLDPRITPFTEVIRNLSPIVGDAQHALDLFGKRGSSAVLALTRNVGEFDQMLGVIGKSGTAAAMAATQMEGLGASFKNLKSRVELLGIALGENGVTGPLRVLIDIGRVLATATTAMIDTAFGRLIISAAALAATLGALGVTLVGIKWLGSTTLVLGFANALKPLIAGFQTAMLASTGMTSAITIMGVAFNPVALAALAAAGALAIFISSARNYGKEMTEAVKSSDKFADIAERIKSFKEATANMEEGSTEFKSSIKSFRDELLASAKDMPFLAAESLQAANSIDVLNGKFIDGGAAVEAYQQKMKGLQSAKLAEAANISVDSMLEGTDFGSRFLDSTKGVFDTLGIFSKHMLNSAANSLMFWREGQLEMFEDFTAKLGDNWKRVKLGDTIAKSVSEGKLSFKEMGDYIEKMGVPITAQEKRLKAMYGTWSEQSAGVLRNLMEVNGVTLSHPVEMIEQLGKGADLSKAALDGVVSMFKQMQDADTSGIDVWTKDYKGIENAEDAVKKLMGIYGQYKDQIVTTGEKEQQAAAVRLAGYERERFAIAQKKKAIEDTYKAELQAAGGDSGKQSQAQIKQLESLKQLEEQRKDLNKRIYDDEAAHSLNSIRLAESAYNKTIELNKDKFRAGSTALASANATALTTFKQAIDKAVTTVYEPKEILARQKAFHEELESYYTKYTASIQNQATRNEISQVESNIRILASEELKWKQIAAEAEDAYTKIAASAKKGDPEFDKAKATMDDSQAKVAEAEAKKLAAIQDMRYTELKKVQDAEITQHEKFNAQLLAVESLRHAQGKTTDRQYQDIQFNIQKAHYAKMIKLAEQHVADLNARGYRPDNKEYLDALKDLENANIKSNEFIAQNTIDMAERAREDAQKIRDRELADIQKMEQVKLHEIAVSEAAGTLTMEEAEKQRYATAVEYFEKRKATLEGQKIELQTSEAGVDVDAVEEVNNKMKALDADLLEFKSKNLEEYTRKHRKTEEEIAEYVGKDGKIAKAAKDIATKRKAAEDKLSTDIKRINKDLADKRYDIELDLEKKREDINKERVENEKATADAIRGINSTTIDKIDKIRQRSMSDREKEQDNERIAAKKYAEGVKLIAQAEKENDRGKLEAGKQLIQQYSDLVAERKNDNEAINGVKKAEQELVKAANVEKKIKDSELLTKQKEAEADATDKIAKAEREGTDAKTKVLEDYTAEKKKQADLDTEALQKLDKELGKLQEKDAIWKSILESMGKASGGGDTTLAATPPASKGYGKTASTTGKVAPKGTAQVSGGKQTTKSDTGTGQIVGDLGEAKQAATEVGQQLGSSIVDGAAKGGEAVGGMFKRIEADGTVAWSNVQAAQERAIDPSITAKFGEGAVSTIENIGGQAVQVVRDQYGQLLEIFGDGVNIKVNRDPNSYDPAKEIPSEVNTTVKSNTAEAVSSIQSLQQEYESLITKADGVILLPPDSSANVEEIKNKFAELFAIASDVTPQQRIQDMINTLNSMGTLPSDTFRDYQQKIVEAANAVGGLVVELDTLGSRGSTWIESTKLVDQFGNEIKGLSDDIKSNPFELGFSTEHVIQGLDNLKGLTDTFRSTVEEPIVPTLQPAGVKQSLAEIQAEKDKLNEPLAPMTVDVTGKEKITEAVDEAKKIEDEEATLDVDANTSKAEASVDAVSAKIKDVETSIPIDADTSGVDSALDDVAAKTKDMPAVEVDVKSTTELDAVITKLEELKNKKVSVDFEVKGSKEVIDTLEAIDKAEKSINIAVSATVVGQEQVNALQEVLAKIVDKTVTVTAEVYGMDRLAALKTAIDNLRDKTITVTTNYVTNKAGGGLVALATGGHIQAYADGGSVFKRLSNRLITTGSGTKDDVPAMLMKDEFVHRSAAVKKYGVRFMHMVNSLQFPKDLVPQFANGGLVGDAVQYFAKGGQVMSLAKKKLFEMLGLGSGVNINVGAFNVHSEINKVAEGITDPIGINALSAMTKSYTDAVGGFAAGGKIDTSAVMSQAELNKLTLQYNTQINAAKAAGNDEIAAILEKEKQDLINLAESLASKLKELKDEYETQVEERKTGHKTEKEERDAAYLEDNESGERDYKEQVEDDNRGYARDEFDYAKEQREKIEDFNKSVVELDEELASSKDDHAADLSEAEIKLAELKEKVAAYRKQLASRTGWYMSWDGVSDKIDIETLIRDFHSKEPKPRTTYRRVWDGNIVGNGNAYDILGPGGSRAIWGPPDEKAVAETLAKWKSEYEKPLKEAQEKYDDLKKNTPEVEHDKKLGEITVAFAKDKEDSDLSRSRYLEDKELAVFRRDRAYNESRTEADTQYKEETEAADLSLKTDLDAYKVQYEEAVGEALKTNKDEVAQVKTDAAKALEEAKRKLSENLGKMKDDYSANTTSMSGGKAGAANATTSGVADSVSVQKFGMSIEELLKRLGKGILRFNTGGLVPFVRGAKRGTDSILAKLSPYEYIIRESAVKALGVPFLDAINNLQIPAFSNGGAVTESSLSSSMSKVVHALDLTYNGSNIGELTGNQMTVEGFIEALNMAKLRS